MGRRRALLKLNLLAVWLVLLLRRSSAAPPSAPVTMELWCVAKNNAEDAALQAALDWACGLGGADCGPIQQGGPCYDAADIQSMASFAFNSYYLKNAMTDHSCYFDNAAALTSLNPSHDKCKFPSSMAVSNGSIASPSTALGLGPSQDMSGCNPIAQARQWFWPIFSASLLFLTSYSVG